MNRLRNEEFHIEGRNFTPPTYDDFVKVLQLTNEFSRKNLINFVYGVKSSVGPRKKTLEKLERASRIQSRSILRMSTPCFK